MEPLLQIIGLSKSYRDVTVLNNITLTINKGDIYGLIGKNGAGKTTLMKTLLGLTELTSGKYIYNGIENNSDFRKKCGSIIERPALYPSCSVLENMKRYSIIFGGTDKEINKILCLVGMEEHKNKKASELSLGMKQRLGIGIALLGNPELLILDEPVNGLDPTGIIEIRNLILDLNKNMNTTVLISSHLLDELSKIVSRYGILDHGNLVEEITSEELKHICKKKMIFHVDNVEKSCNLLNEKFGISDIVIEKNTIVLFSDFENSALINKELCYNGIQVFQVIINSESLEQYFVRKVGE